MKNKICAVVAALSVIALVLSFAFHNEITRFEASFKEPIPKNERHYVKATADEIYIAEGLKKEVYCPKEDNERTLLNKDKTYLYEDPEEKGVYILVRGKNWKQLLNADSWDKVYDYSLSH